MINRLLNIGAVLGLIMASAVSMHLSFSGAMIVIKEPIIAGMIAGIISLFVAISGYRSRNSNLFRVSLFCAILVSVSLNFAGKTTQINDTKQQNETRHRDSSRQDILDWESALKEHKKDEKSFVENNISRAENLRKTESGIIRKETALLGKDKSNLVSEISTLARLIKRRIKPRGNKRKLKIAKNKLKGIEKKLTSRKAQLIRIQGDVIKASNIAYRVPAPIKPDDYKKAESSIVSNDDVATYLAYLLSLIADVLAALFSASIRRQREDDFKTRDETEQRLRGEIDALSASSRDSRQDMSDLSRLNESLTLKLSALVGENARLKSEMKNIISERLAVAKIKGDATIESAKAKAVITKAKAKKAVKNMKKIDASKILGMIKRREFVPDARLGTVSINVICDKLGNDSRSAKEAASEAISEAKKMGIMKDKGNSSAYSDRHSVANLHVVGA